MHAGQDKKSAWFSLAWCLRLLFSVLLIAAIIAWIGADAVRLAWAGLSWKVWLAIPILQILSLVLRGWRAEMTLLERPCMPSLNFVLIASVHNAANQTMPMRSGELAYPYLLKRYCNFVLGKGVASLLYIRVYELFVLVLLVLAAFASMLTGVETGSVKFVLLLLVLLSGLYLLWVKTPAMVSSFIPLLTRYAGEQATRSRAYAARLAGFLDSLVIELQRPKSVRLHLGVFFLTLLNWISLILIFWIVMLGVGIPVDFLQTIVGSSFASISQFIPVGTLGNFGPMEAGWVVGFAFVGVDVQSALNAGIIMHLLTFANSLLIGSIAWMLLHWLVSGTGDDRLD